MATRTDTASAKLDLAIALLREVAEDLSPSKAPTRRRRRAKRTTKKKAATRKKAASGE